MRTDDHDIEVETFSDALSMPLIRQICKSNVARELPPHNVPHIAGSLGSSLGVL